eukprot:1184350-Prorocentrum_minimum.AAC.5
MPALPASDWSAVRICLRSVCGPTVVTEANVKPKGSDVMLVTAFTRDLLSHLLALAKTERDFHKFEIRPTPRTLRRPLIRLLPPHNYYTACLQRVYLFEARGVVLVSR